MSDTPDDSAADRADDESHDEDPLAVAYETGLAREKAGDIEGAVKAYRDALALDADDPGGVAVRIAALGEGETPERAPPAYVATLFDQHAEIFDDILVERLGYAVPLMAREELIARGATPIPRLLDLGCGTGLCGEAFADVADRMTGVDLSAGMIEIADEKEVYADLYVADAVAFLERGPEGLFEAILAADVLPYLGSLDGLFAGVAARLVAGGHFVFSSETLPAADLAGAPFQVGPHQRFGHDPAYVVDTLAAAGLQVTSIAPIVVRHEEGQPIHGHLVVASAPAAR